MGLLIVDTDFTGKFLLAKNSFTNYTDSIAKYEEKYLRDMLGNALFELFKADVDGTTKKPVTAKYLNLYNAIHQDIDQSRQQWPFSNMQLNSEGMKIMILGFVYWEIMRDQPIANTTSGNVSASNEVANKVTYDDSNTDNRYNDSINSYNSIQYYIYILNKSVYPEFNGVLKRKVGWML